MQGIDNFVEEQTSTTGTGDLSLSSVNGARDFSKAFTTGGTDEFFYAVFNPNMASEYEFGLGHLVDSTTLSRDTVIDSSNSDSLVSFSSGTKKIICDVPAERILDKNRLQGCLQPDGLVIANNSTNPNTDLDVAVGGNVWVHDPADASTGIVVDAPISSPAIQLDTSGAGGRLNSTLETNQWYEPGVIASFDGKMVDYATWKPANRPTGSGDLPNGYDYYRSMGSPGKTWWIRTDGSSDIISFEHFSDGNLTLDVGQFGNLLNTSTPTTGSNQTLKISSQSPPVKANIRFNNLRLRSTNDGNEAVISVDNTALSSVTEGEDIFSNGNANRISKPFWITGVESQQINWFGSSDVDGILIRQVSRIKAVD